MSTTAELNYIGHVSSQLQKLKECPKQENEGAPAATLHIYPAYREAMLGLKPGSKLILLTWLDRSDRTALQVHPRGNRSNALKGVFLTRSPNRPNPIGLHTIKVLALEGDGVLQVEPLEVLDNTPIIDIKISLSKD